MGRIKCVKIKKCPICGDKGSIQVFFNKQGKIKYGRTRHYIGLKNKKPQFNYCKLEDLQQLETLLKTLGFQFPTAQPKALGHKVSDLTGISIKSGQADLSSKSRIKGAGSSVRIEHHPPKVGVVGSNPTPPAGDTPRTVLEIQVGYLRFLKILKLL
jgi:hypothetical protein